MRKQSFIFLVLCCVSAFVMAANTDAQEVDDAKASPLEKPPKLLKSQEEFDRLPRKEQWRIVEWSIRKNKTRIGLVYLGAYGELIVSPGGLLQGDIMTVIPEDDDLALYSTQALAQAPYARITADGAINYLSQEKSGIKTKAAPTQWPKKGKGKWSMPPAWTVLRNESVDKNKDSWIDQPPENAERFVVLTPSGGLIFLPEEAQPFPNVLWIFRTEEGGFDFVHAGPARQGLYMRVHRDRTIIFTDPADARPGYSDLPPMWPYIHERTEMPVLPFFSMKFTREGYLDSFYPESPCIWQSDTQPTMMEGRAIE